jgi:hypothetical protein
MSKDKFVQITTCVNSVNYKEILYALDERGNVYLFSEKESGREEGWYIVCMNKFTKKIVKEDRVKFNLVQGETMDLRNAR